MSQSQPPQWRAMPSYRGVTLPDYQRYIQDFQVHIDQRLASFEQQATKVAAELERLQKQSQQAESNDKRQGQQQGKSKQLGKSKQPGQSIQQVESQQPGLRSSKATPGDGDAVIGTLPTVASEEYEAATSQTAFAYAASPAATAAGPPAVTGHPPRGPVRSVLRKHS